MRPLTVRAEWLARRLARLRRQRSKPRGPPQLLPHNVTPARLLRVALLGNDDGNTAGRLHQSGAPPDSIQAMVRELMTLSGDPSYASLLEMVVARSMEQRTMAPTDPSLARGRTAKRSTDAADQHGSPAIRDATPRTRDLKALLMSASNMAELVRMVVWALDGADGPRLALELARLVEPAVAVLLSDTQPPDVVVAMNSIAGVFRRQAVPLPICFYALALKYAAVSQQTAAMRRYLMDCRQHNYRFEAREVSSICSKLIRHCGSRPFHWTGGRELGGRFGAWRRHDALRILTGWRTAGVPDPGEGRDICIQDFVPLDEPGSMRGYVEALVGCRASSGLIYLWWVLPDHQRVGHLGRQPPPTWSRLPSRSESLARATLPHLPFRHPERAASRLSAMLFFITRALIWMDDSRAALDLALDNIWFLEWDPPNGAYLKHPQRTLAYLLDWRKLSGAITDRFGQPADARYLVRFATIFLPDPLSHRFHQMVATTMEQSLASIERCLGVRWITGLPNHHEGLHVRADAIRAS